MGHIKIHDLSQQQALGLSVGLWQWKALDLTCSCHVLLPAQPGGQAVPQQQCFSAPALLGEGGGCHTPLQAAKPSDTTAGGFIRASQTHLGSFLTMVLCNTKLSSALFCRWLLLGGSLCAWPPFGLVAVGFSKVTVVEEAKHPQGCAPPEASSSPCGCRRRGAGSTCRAGMSCLKQAVV